MARLSMSEMTTYRWSFEEDVANYAAAGIHGIGVWRQKLSDFGEERGIELLNESGLQVSNLLWAGGFTGGDGRSLRDSIEDGFEAIRQAADMRAGCLVVYSGGRAGHTRGHARRLLGEALRALLPMADEFGVTLAIEPMHADCAAGWTFLTSLDEAREYLDRFDSTRLRVVVDTYHAGLDDRALHLLAEMAPRTAVVHLADGHLPLEAEQNRCLLGTGLVRLKECVEALAAGGYDGYYDIELIGPEIENTDYHQVLRRSKESFEQLLGSAAAM